MVGRPKISREEMRKNQIVVPVSEGEKKRIQYAAKKSDRSVAGFVRAVLNEHLKEE